MNPLNVFVAAFALLFGSQAFAQGSCGLTPEHAAVMLYEKHRTFLFTPQPEAPLTEVFAKLAASNVTANGDAGVINWDFWTDAQDGEASPEAKAVRVERHNVSTTVILEYTFTLDPSAKATPTQTRVQVTEKSRDCWVVSDLVRGRKSARAILQAAARK